MLEGSVTIFGLAVNPSLLVLVAAVICLVIGYLIGATLSSRGVSLETGSRRRGEEMPFLKGMRSMLARDTDQAIADLTRAVELDSETVETYIALGHLYRSKGIFDRAISLRQSIIARPKLDPRLRIQALYDLGLDYRAGGFLSRAQEAFQEVLSADPKHLQALTALAQVYEEMRDWEKALETRKRLDKLEGKSRPEIMAQLRTEHGKQLFRSGHPQEAQAAFKKALSLDKSCTQALLCLGDLYLDRGDTKKALTTWRKIAASTPELTFLALERVVNGTWMDKERPPIEAFIQEAAIESKDPWAQILAARHLAAQGREEETIEALRRILKTSSAYLPAHRDLGKILIEGGQIDEILTAYQELLNNLPGNGRSFECGGCGYSSAEVFWKCPSCRRWGTIAVHTHS